MHVLLQPLQVPVQGFWVETQKCTTAQLNECSLPASEWPAGTVLCTGQVSACSRPSKEQPASSTRAPAPPAALAVAYAAQGCTAVAAVAAAAVVVKAGCPQPGPPPQASEPCCNPAVAVVAVVVTQFCLCSTHHPCTHGAHQMLLPSLVLLVHVLLLSCC